MSKTNQTRSLATIAREIRSDWRKPYFGAVPYLNAMTSLVSTAEDDLRTEMYGYDSVESIVLYFLSNATTWRGDTACRIKAELKAMVKVMRTYRVVCIYSDEPGFHGASGVYRTHEEAQSALLDTARTWVGLVAPELRADGSFMMTTAARTVTYSILSERA